MVGTTRFMTDSTGADIDSAVYTAFGERISGTQHRYGYLGASGFEASSSDDPGDPYLGFGSLHVNPYYDQATGRSLQRDPIGIRGGTNVYAYVFNRSTVGVDPTGKGFWGSVWSGVKIVGGAVGTIVGGALIVAGTIGSSPVWVAGIGLAVFVGGAWVAISEIVDIFDTADKIVKPIRKPVKRRNRAVDNAINCAWLGMEED